MAISKNIGIDSSAQLSNKEQNEGSFITISELEKFQQDSEGNGDDVIFDDKFMVEFYHPKGDKVQFFTKASIKDYNSHLSFKVSYEVNGDIEEHILGSDTSIFVENVNTSEKSFVKTSEIHPTDCVLLNNQGEFLAYIVDIQQINDVHTLKTITTREHLGEEEIAPDLSTVMLKSGLIVKTK